MQLFSLSRTQSFKLGVTLEAYCNSNQYKINYFPDLSTKDSNSQNAPGAETVDGNAGGLHGNGGMAF